MRKESSTTSLPASEANSWAMPPSRSERSPASFILAALSISNRAASTLVAMSASLNWIAWCWAIGFSDRGAWRAARSRDVHAPDLERVHHLAEALVQAGLLAAQDHVRRAAVAVEHQLGRLDALVAQ